MPKRYWYLNAPRAAVCACVPCVCHTPVLYRNSYTDRADYLPVFHRPTLRCFRKIRVSPKLWTRKFRHRAPTIGKFDINSDSGRSGIDSTWRGGDATDMTRVRSAVDDDCRLSIALDVQRDYGFGVRHRRAGPSA